MNCELLYNCDSTSKLILNTKDVASQKWQGLITVCWPQIILFQLTFFHFYYRCEYRTRTVSLSSRVMWLSTSTVGPCVLISRVDVDPWWRHSSNSNQMKLHWIQIISICITCVWFHQFFLGRNWCIIHIYSSKMNVSVGYD